MVPVTPGVYTFQFLPFGLCSSQLLCRNIFLQFLFISSVSPQYNHVPAMPSNRVTLGRTQPAACLCAAHGTAAADLDFESWKPSWSSLHSSFPFHPRTCLPVQWLTKPHHGPCPTLVATYVLESLLFGNCWALSGGISVWKTEKSGISVSSSALAAPLVSGRRKGHAWIWVSWGQQ